MMGNCNTVDDDDDDDSFDELFELNNPMSDERGFNTAVNISEISNDDDDDVSGPWPSGHRRFLNSSIARKNLCLEIATGSSSKNRSPEWIPYTSNRHIKDDVTLNEDGGSTVKGPGVLWPGSLREHGDFCLVHMSLVQQQGSKDYAACAFGWEVQDVEFHTVNKF